MTSKGHIWEGVTIGKVLMRGYMKTQFCWFWIWYSSWCWNHQVSIHSLPQSCILSGSVIRCVRRLEETLRQMVQASKAIGNTELENKFAEGESCTFELLFFFLILELPFLSYFESSSFVSLSSVSLPTFKEKEPLRCQCYPHFSHSDMKSWVLIWWLINICFKLSYC